MHSFRLVFRFCLSFSPPRPGWPSLAGHCWFQIVYYSLSNLRNVVLLSDRHMFNTHRTYSNGQFRNSCVQSTLAITRRNISCNEFNFCGCELSRHDNKILWTSEQSEQNEPDELMNCTAKELKERGHFSIEICSSSLALATAQRNCRFSAIFNLKC